MSADRKRVRCGLIKYGRIQSVSYTHLEVAYYSCDTNYYAAGVDNKVYLVNKMNVKELFTAFESVVGTEEDSSDKTDADEATTDEMCIRDRFL